MQIHCFFLLSVITAVLQNRRLDRGNRPWRSRPGCHCTMCCILNIQSRWGAGAAWQVWAAPRDCCWVWEQMCCSSGISAHNYKGLAA